MSDKEQLELAAKAAGIAGEMEDEDHAFWIDRHRGISWNPLTDDGDALRLAVRLCIGVHHDDPMGVVVGWTANQRVTFTADGWGPWHWKEWLRDHGGSRPAATRRAIVRAAAQLVQKT